MNKLIVSAFVLLLMLGCSRSAKYADILNQANELISSKPDSVSKLLDLIDAPENLPLPAKADYGYFKSFAHQKTDKAMADDSLILFTLDYYKKNNNTGKLSRTYSLASAYYKWKNDKSNAFKMAQERLQYNIEANDSAEIANSYSALAYLNWNEKNYKSVIKYMTAASRYDLKGAYDRDYVLGLAYACNEQPDSAMLFLQKSIESAIAHRDTMFASHYIRNYADFLNSLHKYTESISTIYKLRRIHPVLDAQANLTIASTYLDLHQLDSAQVYLNMANKMRTPEVNAYNIEVPNFIMAMQAVINYTRGNPVDWGTMGRYNDSISNILITGKSLDDEGTNVRNQLEHKNIKLTVTQQRTLFALISVVLLAALLTLLFVLYNWKKQEKIEALQTMLKEAMRSNDANKDDAFFKKMLLQQLGLVRLVATTPTSQNQALLKQITNIANKDIPVEELLNWDDLYQTIDSIYADFHVRLVQNHGTVLNDREIQLCCLLCAEFSTKEISIVTQQSVRTVYQRKTTIRHKLGIDDKDDIVGFLNAKKTEAKLPI